jgi:hypothetical protein
VAFAATEFKNGFVPDEWLQASAQDLIPELRVGNMPGVRRCVIEIEICGRSHRWFPHWAWLENNSSSRSPKTDYLWRAGAIPALRDFPLGATPIAFSPFRAIALRNYQLLSVPSLARLMDCQASLWQRL